MAAATTLREDLLERREALELLREAWAAASAGRGRVAFVAGEAGIGKTALVRRFAEAEVGGAPVLRGVCDALFTPRPLGAFLELAAEAGGELEAAVRAAADSHDVAAAMMRELRAGGPTLVVLEDVHWADESTLDVLKLVARQLETVPALLVATYRDDELEPSHLLRHLLGHLPARRVVLERLTSAAVAGLAAPEGLDPDDLFRKTGGNPFFVTEVLAAPADDIPATVRDAVLARCARASEQARALLGAVAVSRPESELWLLEALAPDELGALEECLASGMLRSNGDRVGFRHELARLTVEESLAPDRRLELHRRALATLSSPSHGASDLARLAHHAEAAGDRDAVLRFAPAAGERAQAVGAHREAADQFARALRFAEGLEPADRAELHRRRAQECYVVDRIDDALASAQAAIACHRESGDRVAEGRATVFLSSIAWCPGLIAESNRAGREAVEILEDVVPRGHELARAYGNMAARRNDADDLDGVRAWAGRALELARELGDDVLACRAAAEIAEAEVLHGDAGAVARLEEEYERTVRLGDAMDIGIVLGFAKAAVRVRMYDTAAAVIERGLENAQEHGRLLSRLYLLSYRTRIELDTGRWTEAADTAGLILRERWISTLPRTVAFTALGLVRARRGDPGWRVALDEALALAEGTGEPERTAPVAAARAEAAWLEGRHDAALSVTAEAYELAVERRVQRFVGELAVWRRRAGANEARPDGAAEPYAAELAGEWRRAAAAWRELGCPYEEALALAEGDEGALRRSLELLQKLGARPAAAIVARRLRDLGARGVPRGPRASTVANVSALTVREVEVLRLVADGLRNAVIAERLVVSTRTVDHHVSSILRKLAVGSRGEAVAEARRLGLVEAA